MQNDERRMIVTLPLVRGHDDDLISWVNTLPDKQRSPLLKAALRHALASVPESGFHIGNGHENGNEVRIRELEAAVAYLTSRVEGMTLYPFAPVQESQVEAAPKLTEEELQQRANRLKKANW